MLAEPSTRRVIAFIDGQNLYYAVREAFGYRYPNYDAHALAGRVCKDEGWQLTQTRFYTGLPDMQVKPFWNQLWFQILGVWGTRGVWTFSRKLVYRHQTVTLPDGTTTTVMVGQEKGVDVRLALDVVRLARQHEYDVAIIFSQDQDLSEVAEEVRRISTNQQRWIKIACAFPVSPTYKNRRGIERTDWIRIDRSLYDACIDPLDYRPKNSVSK